MSLYIFPSLLFRWIPSSIFETRAQLSGKMVVSLMMGIGQYNLFGQGERERNEEENRWSDAEHIRMKSNSFHFHREQERISEMKKRKGSDNWVSLVERKCASCYIINCDWILHSIFILFPFSHLNLFSNIPLSFLLSIPPLFPLLFFSSLFPPSHSLLFNFSTKVQQLTMCHILNKETTNIVPVLDNILTDSSPISSSWAIVIQDMFLWDFHLSEETRWKEEKLSITHSPILLPPIHYSINSPHHHHN